MHRGMAWGADVLLSGHLHSTCYRLQARSQEIGAFAQGRRAGHVDCSVPAAARVVQGCKRVRLMKPRPSVDSQKPGKEYP